jgi:hypothetical protein
MHNARDVSLPADQARRIESWVASIEACLVEMDNQEKQWRHQQQQRALKRQQRRSQDQQDEQARSSETSSPSPLPSTMMMTGELQAGHGLLVDNAGCCGSDLSAPVPGLMLTDHDQKRQRARDWLVRLGVGAVKLARKGQVLRKSGAEKRAQERLDLKKRKNNADHELLCKARDVLLTQHRFSKVVPLASPPLYPPHSLSSSPALPHTYRKKTTT